MRAATLLFYAVVTFFLGTISIMAGVPRLLAQLFRAVPMTENGFTTYPTEPWQSILLYSTVAVSLLFVILSFYFAAAPARPRAVDTIPDEDGDPEDADDGTKAEVPEGR